jgi:hypothetical protein
MAVVVFWAVLFSTFDTPFTTWSNVSQHALNSVYALVEILVPRTSPLPWLHIIAVVIILAMYLGLAYVTHATQGFYVYSFLDPAENSRGVVAGYIVGILAASIVIFIVVKYIILARLIVTEKKMGKAGRFSREDSGSQHPGEPVQMDTYGKYSQDRV